MKFWHKWPLKYKLLEKQPTMPGKIVIRMS